ncbi:hypothetical protein cypCar_00017833 [Cyprinus carpio]|nr:hypothetical protein cypCar_00017833 [Cyprinus carpio]
MASKNIAPERTIYQIIKNFKEKGSTAVKSSGRPRVSSKHQDRLLLSSQLQNRVTSSAELAQEWQQRGKQGARKSYHEPNLGPSDSISQLLPKQPTPPLRLFPYSSSLLWLAPPCFWQGVVQSSVSSDSPLFTVRLTLVGPVTATRKQAAFTHYPFAWAVPKPELLCGVCHRLFSTASSLTVHMRLHRGGRVLSCRHCSKAFIHNKRLQSHEATCKQGLPAFPVPPKEEPLEEGEVEGERADEAAEPEQLGQGTRPGRPIKKVRDLHARHAGTLTCRDDLGEEDHFVKVVDGHIIYFCSVCERSYMTLSSLKRHSNVHSWRRKYPCHYCDKVFALAEYRTKHEVWHTVTLPLSIDSSLPQPLDTKKLESFLKDLQTTEPERFPIRVGVEQGKKLASPQTDMAVEARETEGNKMDSEERKRSPENHLMAKTSQKQIKKHSQRVHTETYRDWDAVSEDTEALKIRQPTEKLHKGRKVHNKTESREEAIVKRSISETDLRRDKSPTRSKPKKSHLSQEDQREQRHTNHHQRKHRNSNQEGKERESKWKNPKLKGKRKALHMQGAKAWKRKLHYKRSLRPMRRAERLMKNLNKEIDGEEADEGEDRRQKATTNSQNTASSIIKQRWSEDQASECGTCGRWFSSPRKRDKHELTHLFEFVCMLCRAPFPSQSKLEEHQRTQHPKTKPLSAPTFFTSQSSRNEVEMKADENGVDGRFIEKGSPVRSGRRPLIRYTCSQCDKVCKTSAALNCHLKRHELGSSIEVEDTQEKQDLPSCATSAVETTPSKGFDTN